MPSECLRCGGSLYRDADTLCEHVTAEEVIPEPDTVSGWYDRTRHEGKYIARGVCGPDSVPRHAHYTFSVEHPTREGARALWRERWAIGAFVGVLFARLSEWVAEGARARAARGCQCGEPEVIGEHHDDEPCELRGWSSNDYPADESGDWEGLSSLEAWAVGFETAFCPGGLSAPPTFASVREGRLLGTCPHRDLTGEGLAAAVAAAAAKGLGAMRQVAYDAGLEPVPDETAEQLLGRVASLTDYSAVDGEPSTADAQRWHGGPRHCSCGGEIVQRVEPGVNGRPYLGCAECSARWEVSLQELRRLRAYDDDTGEKLADVEPGEMERAAEPRCLHYSRGNRPPGGCDDEDCPRCYVTVHKGTSVGLTMLPKPSVFRQPCRACGEQTPVNHFKAGKCPACRPVPGPHGCTHSGEMMSGVWYPDDVPVGGQQCQDCGALLLSDGRVYDVRGRPM